MAYKYFIGIDMGKHTFHCCIQHNKKKVRSLELSNNRQGLERLEAVLKELNINLQEEALFCVEQTGIYTNILLEWAGERAYKLWLENPLAIKKSLGIHRGKNDAIDAQRIAQYAARYVDRVRLWKPTKAVLTELNDLLRLRARLTEANKRLKTPLKESKGFIGSARQERLSKACQGSLEAIKADLAEVNKQIDALIKSNEEVCQFQAVVTSVPGIGKLTALALLIATDGFTGIPTAKACACYAGVAPFAHSSGSSIRCRARVSPLANKGIKRLLHLSAMSVIRLPGELQAYYERKVGAGKSKMCVLNAIRNKLLGRIYACVRDMRPYRQEYVGESSIAA